ncbi:MAG: ABC transporter permease [Acidimicrobiia bacterium]|nr:ABC transporter permease [Acidimicrobiia bacterium]
MAGDGGRGGLWTSVRYVARGRPSLVVSIGLVVAIAIVGGIAIGSAMGARRAQHSVSAFITWSQPEDASAFADPSAPPAQQQAALERVRHLPGVVASQRLAVDLASVRPPSGPSAPMIMYVGIDPLLTGIRRGRLVSGRFADPRRADEVVINEDLSHRLHVGVGARLHARVYPRAEIDQLGNGEIPSKALAVVPLRVVGIARQASDLEADPEAEAGSLFQFNGSLIYGSPAYFQRWGQRIAGYGIGVRVLLAHHDVDAFTAAVRRSGARVQVQPGTDIVRDEASLRRSAEVESGALWALAALVALVGLVLIGPALRRTVAVSPNDRVALNALGLTRGNLVAVEVWRGLPIALAGALLSVPVALFAAPHAALGVSKRSLLGTGHPAQPLLLALGALGVLVGVAAVLVVSSLITRTRPPAPDADDLGSVRRGGRFVLGWLAAGGAPASVVAGARMALPSSDRSGGVIRSAIVTVACGVALLVAALTFSASMTHLVDTPGLRGWSWDVEAGNYSELATAQAAGRRLARDPDVADYTGINQVTADGPRGPLPVAGLADVAMAQLPALSGRLPSADGEIAVTPATLDQLHLHLGDRVRLRALRASTFRIVGTTLGPGAVSPDLQLRQGGVAELRSLDRLTDGGSNPESYIIRFRPGVDRTAARARLEPIFRSTVLTSYETTEVQTVRRTEPLPLFFAGLVAVLALGALVYAVTSALRRNRREVALLKALGFGRGQVRLTLLSQTALLGAAACLIGVPAGLIVGRWGWRWAARGVGVLAAPISPPLTMTLIVAAALGTAIVIGMGAARTAVRVSAAETLRKE